MVTNSINGKNTKMHKNNTTGVTGVTLDKNRNKYKAQIVVNHKLDNLGGLIPLRKQYKPDYRLK